MKHSEVLKMVDHTLLAQTATWEEIRQICDDGLRYGTASVCIPPCYVAAAAEYVQGKLPICTVIGFPNGNHTTEAKIYEAQNAIANGVIKSDSSPPVETPTVPMLPANWPIMMRSTVEYSCCTRFVSTSGSAKTSSVFRIDPCVKSFPTRFTVGCVAIFSSFCERYFAFPLNNQQKLFYRQDCCF